MMSPEFRNSPGIPERIDRLTEPAQITAQSLGEVGQGQVIFIPNEKGYHCPGFRVVPLLPGFCESCGIKPAPFAHMSDYLFHADRPVHLLVRSSKSVFGKMVIPKDLTLSSPSLVPE